MRQMKAYQNAKKEMGENVFKKEEAKTTSGKMRHPITKEYYKVSSDNQVRGRRRCEGGVYIYIYMAYMVLQAFF